MTVCVVHQDHEADEGWLCCRRAWGRLAGSLRRIPELCEELEERTEEIGALDPVSVVLPAGPLSASRNGVKVSGSPSAAVPIRIDPTDLLAPARHGSLQVSTRSRWPEDQVGYLSAATTLDFWVRDWADLRGERPPDLSDGERSPVLILAGWLLDRLDWACQHQFALDEFAADVQKISSTLYGLAGHGAARPKCMEAVCPDCRQATLSQPYPEAYIECAMPECGRVLTPQEYEEMIGEMRHEIRAQDVLTVLNGLEPVDLERLRFGVITAGGTTRWDQKTDKIVPCEEHFHPFERGELIVVGANGSEMFGEGRRPYKWDVTCEEFKTLDEAMAKRSEVLKAAEDAA